MTIPCAPTSKRGFMLIEVLVSVLLFSIGVLALVGLQANMQKTQGASKTRTDASYLATELIGMMWSDIKNVSSYQTSSCPNYSRCSVWASKVAKSLPNGQATVSVTVTPDGSSTSNDITINITWSLPDGGTHKYSTSTNIHAS